MLFKKHRSTISKGKQGETLAADHLAKLGYTVLERNYRERFGEIDIIARQNEWLVFIEVKTRGSTKFGSPFDAVTPAKQRQIVRVAEAYIQKRKMEHFPCRFDVVSVQLAADGNTRIEVLPHAFEAFS